jgi:hypothetical protein
VIATLLERNLARGRHTVDWDGKTTAGHTAASGVYFARVESGGAVASRKMILLR